jgi:hypothetical protein
MISLGLWYSLLKISIDIQGYYIPECIEEKEENEADYT